MNAYAEVKNSNLWILYEHDLVDIWNGYIHLDGRQNHKSFVYWNSICNVYVLYSIEDIHRTQDDKRGWKQCRLLIKMSGQSRYGKR